MHRVEGKEGGLPWGELPHSWEREMSHPGSRRVWEVAVIQGPRLNDGEKRLQLLAQHPLSCVLALLLSKSGRRGGGGH